MIKRTLNEETLSIENAETEIREIIKKGFIKNTSKSIVNKKVQAVINRAIKSIDNEGLKADTVRSLNNFATRVQGAFNSIPLTAQTTLFALSKLNQSKGGRTVGISYPTDEKGVPLQEFSKNYIRRVSVLLKDIAEIRALDPNDIRGRNSLRNLAEMELRYQRSTQRIEELRAKGVKLVVASTHADCSDRCFPHQGKIYSLDGTSGATEDGRRFVPLENATDIYYTTKKGKRYKNGLFGFNCRHYLYEFSEGMAIPKVSKAEQEKENAINMRQRYLERKVRHYREQAVMLRDIDYPAFSEARKRAIQANKEYQAFSHAHKRAYYPDRVKIIV